MLLLEAEPHGLTPDQMLPTIQAVDADVTAQRMNNALAELAGVEWITSPGVACPLIDGFDQGRSHQRVWSATRRGLDARPALRYIAHADDRHRGSVGPAAVGLVRDRPVPALEIEIDIAPEVIEIVKIATRAKP